LAVTDNGNVNNGVNWVFFRGGGGFVYVFFTSVTATDLCLDVVKDNSSAEKKLEKRFFFFLDFKKKGKSIKMKTKKEG